MVFIQKVVLLSCGSFNPVTNMHLRMFELARDALNNTGRFHVMEGIISPVGDSYQKKDLLSAKHRWAMLQQALEGVSGWIRVDRWESQQSAWLETVKVLLHHRQVLNKTFRLTSKPTHSKKQRKFRIEDNVVNGDEIGNQAGQAPLLKLLCGADLLESFGTPGIWKSEDIENIVRHFGLVCITRCGSNPEKFIYESDVLTKYKENIILVREWMGNDISATKIRRALHRGESVKYLIPDPVIDYIHEHQLYGVDSNVFISNPVASLNLADSALSEYGTDTSSHGDVDVIRRPRPPLFDTLDYSLGHTGGMITHPDMGRQPVHLASSVASLDGTVAST